MKKFISILSAVCITPTILSGCGTSKDVSEKKADGNKLKGKIEFFQQKKEVVKILMPLLLNSMKNIQI